MAAVSERRPSLLALQLPADFSASSDCRMRFPLPPLAPPASTSDHRLSDFEKLFVLGHGNGGTVYKVRHRRTAAVYALKLLHDDPSLPRGHTARESDILRRTDSPFIVRCHSSFLIPTGDSVLVLEHMDAGSLDSLRSIPFPEPTIAEIARQALLGLAYLHSHQIVHRDIKPSNLLVNRSGEIKIADFGVGKIMRRSLDPCLSYVGTCAYMSSERFDPDAYGGKYDTYAADVWSLGLTLLELHLGHFPPLLPGQRPDWSALMCAIVLRRSSRFRSLPPSSPTLQTPSPLTARKQGPLLISDALVDCPASSDRQLLDQLLAAAYTESPPQRPVSDGKFDPRSSLPLNPKNVAKVVPDWLFGVSFFPYLDRMVVVAGNNLGHVDIWDADSWEKDAVYFYSPHSSPVSRTGDPLLPLLLLGTGSRTAGDPAADIPPPPRVSYRDGRLGWRTCAGNRGDGTLGPTNVRCTHS